MVDGRHLEKALAVGELEIGDLQDDGRGLDHIDDANDKDDERVSREEREPCRKTAEKERACVTHEDAGGIPVVNKEAEASAEHESAEEDEGREVTRKARNADADGDEKDADDSARRGAKSVDAVRQIHAVVDARDEEQGERIVSNAEIPLDRGEGDRDGGEKIAKERHSEEIKT